MSLTPQDQQNVARVPFESRKTGKEPLVATLQTRAKAAGTEETPRHAQKLKAMPFHVWENFQQQSQMVVSKRLFIGRSVLPWIREASPRPIQKGVFSPRLAEYGNAVRSKHTR